MDTFSSKNMDLNLESDGPLEPKNVSTDTEIGKKPADWQPCWLKLAIM